MSRATPMLRNFAERLIRAEGKLSAKTNPPFPFPVCEKLRPQLATLMGNAGFRALLSRSLALAGSEVIWLRAVHVKGDGTLEMLDDAATQVDPEEFYEGRIVLLAQLLGLLVAFIGESLTIHMMSELWPKISLTDLNFNGGKNEKTK